MHKPTRREALACAGALSLIPTAALAEAPRSPFGVVIHSYGNRVAASRSQPASKRFDDAFVFLDYCHAIGAAGVQVGIGAREPAECDRLRERTQAHGMYLEGTIQLPRDPSDLDRFTAEAESAKRSGATLLRTSLLNGRRYEVFSTAAAFRKAADDSYRSLTLAEPVIARTGMRLAIENHKDMRADELVAILKRINSEHVGVCLDTGNSIALLEDPMEVVETLAPHAFTTHIKDMGVREYEQGFLLSEVPLGDGFVDMAKVFRAIRAAHPEIRLNLEMITRDPLRVPCLTDKYWATFETLPGRHLARMLTLVRTHSAKDPLPVVTGMAADEKLRVEDENVRRCLAASNLL